MGEKKFTLNYLTENKKRPNYVEYLEKLRKEKENVIIKQGKDNIRCIILQAGTDCVLVEDRQFTYNPSYPRREIIIHFSKIDKIISNHEKFEALND